jgi:hypothetical protein
MTSFILHAQTVMHCIMHTQYSWHFTSHTNTGGAPRPASFLTAESGACNLDPSLTSCSGTTWSSCNHMSITLM